MMAQSSPLLDLPRELREMIWQEVFAGDVLHVSYDGSSESPKYLYHLCDAPQPWSSSACPPKTADHKDCCSATSRTFNTSLLQVCKQINAEILSLRARPLFFSRNAFQFSNVSTAATYIFGLAEEDRAAITDLRLALSYSPDDNPNEIVNAERTPFQHLMNYYSFRFHREELGVPDETHLPEESRRPYAKTRVGFYYSNCYYSHNSHRMGKRWQVSFENISWDIGISDLKEKIRPRISLAKVLLDGDKYLYDFPERESWEGEPEEDQDLLEEEQELRWWNEGRWWGWAEPLKQFKQYGDLDLRFYDAVDEELTENLKYKGCAESLKEKLQEPKIGPHPCVFFR